MALSPSAQNGLQVSDVVVAINGESVVSVPDINMMIRGKAGQSVRLEVLRAPSSSDSASSEAIITTPISIGDASNLRQSAWESKTLQLAEKLAKVEGFAVGYMHIRQMNRDGQDSFTRGFFPAFDRDGLIIDVRHNSGGNTDSWILTYLQRKAWMYWSNRGTKRYGDLDWTEQFAFRGKIVLLIDEQTSSNGEGLARGIKELGLGKLVGTRTWGGGIWGSSANHLVDGGIAAAPQWGFFNKKFGYGAGIEASGVEPDIVVEADPHLAFDGKDEQLERAIIELSEMIKQDPVQPYLQPPNHPDMSLHDEDCS